MISPTCVDASEGNQEEALKFAPICSLLLLPRPVYCVRTQLPPEDANGLHSSILMQSSSDLSDVTEG